MCWSLHLQIRRGIWLNGSRGPADVILKGEVDGGHRWVGMKCMPSSIVGETNHVPVAYCVDGGRLEEGEAVLHQDQGEHTFDLDPDPLKSLRMRTSAWSVVVRDFQWLKR